MAHADEEWARREYERLHPGITFPRPHGSYLVDREGMVYTQAANGDWRPTGRRDYSAAAELQKGPTPVYLVKANNGRALYEDPSRVPTIRLIPNLRLPVVPKSRGLGAMEIFGLVGILVIIGVVIGIFVSRHGQSGGYPPSRTFADPTSFGGGRGISAIAISRDGKELVAADFASGANLWNVHSGKLVYDFTSSRYATRAAISPNGKLLAIGDYYGYVYVWNIASRRQIANFEDTQANGFDSPNSGGVYGLSFSPDGKTLAAAEFSGNVHLWSVANWRETSTLTVPSDDTGGLVGWLAFSPNGRTLAVGDPEGTTYVWNARTGKRMAVLDYAHSSTTGIVGVAFSPNGRTLATLQTDGATILWNVSTWSADTTLPSADANGECSIAFSPNGKSLAAGCSGANTYLWDLSTKQQMATLTAPSGGIVGTVFSPDGSVIAAGTGAGYIYFWNVADLGAHK